MTTGHFHTIIIGAGSGGMTVAIGLAGLGKKVALVEAHHVGGDCTNVGCVPSKTLIHLARHFNPGDSPDEIIREVTRKRDALRDKETEEIQHVENLTFIKGTARFISSQTIAVDADQQTRELSADHIVISTGARPRPLDIPGLPAERVLTNESMFDLQHIPQHMVIVGAGVIAVEMAFALRKLGTRVTMFALDARPLSRAIPEASIAIQAELEQAGILTYYHTTAKAFDEASRSLTIVQGEREIIIDQVDQVLIAIGRLRNLESLDLEKAGIKVDRRQGILVNTYGETNIKGVYAVGDVTPTSAFTHSANAQGRRVVQRIAFPFLPLAKNEPLFPNATFSDPEVATVGMTEQQLASAYHPDLVKRIRVDLSTQTDRGYTDGVEHGFIIVDVIRLTGRILHTTIVGPRASEMISFFTLAISQKISLYKIYRLVYPYPTFSSGILKVADIFMKESLSNLGKELGAYLKYRLVKPKSNQQ
ncbi:MAG: NAD(P)/FAD-dependent oxidoreductase [Brevefilum sp.]|nr:NAD(P)/FAD-dependent oxidoreductase [Brevefilum sp.]